MADFFDWSGGTGREGRACFGVVDDYELRYGIAPWTQRSRIRLFGRAHVMGYSSYFMVCTRYSDFVAGCSADGKSAAGLRYCSWGSRLRGATDLRPICFS